MSSPGGLASSILAAMQARRPRQRRAQSAGFTLVELMTVVLIVGVLAMVCVILVRKHFQSAKVSNAVLGMQIIRVAEEATRAQTGEYVDCSTTAGGLYPVKVPDATTSYDWRQPTHDDWPRWQQIGLPHDGGTKYGFLANAGRPGVPASAYPDLLVAAPLQLPDPAQDLWYVIQVQGRASGQLINGLVTSLSGEVFLESSDGSPL